DRFYGPGATDMKGGLVIALDALRAIKRELLASSLAVDVVINGDEELGSPHSRDLIREHARGARFALVFENAPTDSAVIVGRRGLGRARVEITGKAAHAGINPEQGASAVIEAAHKVIAISRYHDPQGGLGVVVGLMSGGRSRNTVPPNAELAIDLRYVDRARAESVLESLRGIGEAQTVPGTTSRFTGELHRPPMLAVSPHQRVALASVQDAADALQLGALDALETGGGSDANLTADLGVPSIDGLGVVGGAIHTDREWGLRASLGSRTALTAELLLQLGVAGL
ncbi:MAG: M20/M25/M40 family metallo-hydrolase, partial [Planctomycetota bacterium]